VGESTWTLTFVDGGRAILTTTQQLHPGTYEYIRDLWERWVTAPTPEIMIIGDCEVLRTGSVELDISEDAIIVRGHKA